MSSFNILTSLSRARSWAGVNSTSEDALLTSLISEASRFILNYIGRAGVGDARYTELHSGNGRNSMLLRQWPVTSVSQLTINDMDIPPASNTTSTGFVLEPWDGIGSGAQQLLSLRGYAFTPGVGNISVAYNAGYKVIAESWIIPAAGNTVTVNAPYGSFASDGGVSFVSGGGLIAVIATPAVGQYSVNSGVYVFAAADAGKTVLISYSYIPSDLEHACVAMVAERYRYRSRIGEISKSVGGQETASYSQKDMPEFVRTLLQPYRRIV